MLNIIKNLIIVGAFSTSFFAFASENEAPAADESSESTAVSTETVSTEDASCMNLFNKVTKEMEASEFFKDFLSEDSKFEDLKEYNLAEMPEDVKMKVNLYTGKFALIMKHDVCSDGLKATSKKIRDRLIKWKNEIDQSEKRTDIVCKNGTLECPAQELIIQHIENPEPGYLKWILGGGAVVYVATNIYSYYGTAQHYMTVMGCKLWLSGMYSTPMWSYGHSRARKFSYHGSSIQPTLQRFAFVSLNLLYVYWDVIAPNNKWEGIKYILFPKKG